MPNIVKTMDKYVKAKRRDLSNAEYRDEAARIVRDITKGANSLNRGIETLSVILKGKPSYFDRTALQSMLQLYFDAAYFIRWDSYKETKHFERLNNLVSSALTRRIYIMR